MAWLVYPILLLPLLAAVVIGAGTLCGRLCGVGHEGFTAAVSKGAIYLAAVCSLLLPGVFGTVQPELAGSHEWFRSGELALSVTLAGGGLHSRLCALFAWLFIVVFRFAPQYMHREEGFHRFFSLLCLFAFSMFLLVLSGSAESAFVAWEVAGVSSLRNPPSSPGKWQVSVPGR